MLQYKINKSKDKISNKEFESRMNKGKIDNKAFEKQLKY